MRSETRATLVASIARGRRCLSVGAVNVRTASLGDGAHPSRAVSDAASHTPTIFEKLFGKSFQLTLAYAAPDDAGLGDGQSLTSGRYDRWTVRRRRGLIVGHRGLLS
jgi:hypothetical protein